MFCALSPHCLLALPLALSLSLSAFFLRPSLLHTRARVSCVVLSCSIMCACDCKSFTGSSRMARLVVDTRERALMRQLDAKDVSYRALNLPVGDCICHYEEGGCAWVMERKRADDLAASIQDGRWREQTSRMFGTGHRVIFCIEGDLRGIDAMYSPMLGAIINANLRDSICIRTMDVDETACLVLHLVTKMQKCAPPFGSATGGLRPPQSKRQRASEAENVFARQLMCVPSVSEKIAVAIVDHFGHVEELQKALRDTRTFPRVPISDKSFLGKARISKLAKVFVKSEAV